LINCVSTTYVINIKLTSSQYNGGSGTKPIPAASGEMGNHMPIATIANEVRINGRLAMLWMNGILFVRMT
jgi:hypothetical protein